MKVSYVTPYGPDYTSIDTHTAERQATWREQGVEVAHHVIGAPGRGGRGAVDNLVRDVADVSRLVRDVRAARPDVVYLRWLTPIPGMVGRLRQIAPVVLEIHANDLVESIGKSSVRRIYASATRGRELRHASGASFVTEELRDDPVFDLIRGPRAVFPNGTTLKRRASIPRHPRPRIGMSVGAVLPWTGIDVFGDLARSMPAMDFVIACPQAHLADVERAAGEHVTVVGTRNQRDYVDELTTWTAGVGTLALYRKGLTTAAPLKVRDYLGLGLPSVIPYVDAGLGAIEDPCVLKLAHGSPLPSTIDPELLAEFVQRVDGRNVATTTSDAVSVGPIEARRVLFLASFRR